MKVGNLTMKKYAVAIYDHNVGTQKIVFVEATELALALLKGIKKVDISDFNSYKEYIEDIGEDFGNVGDIKEYFHEILELDVKEIM